MGVNIFAVTYEPTKYVELLLLDENDIEYISSSIMLRDTLLGLIDPYDNTFFNKKQMKMLVTEISVILANKNNFDNNEVYEKLLSLKEKIHFASSNYAYLIFTGD